MRARRIPWSGYSGRTEVAGGRLRRLIAYLQRTHDEEREKVVRMVHDELLSRLVRVNLDLGGLRRRSKARAAGRGSVWSAVSQHLQEAIRIAAQVCAELRPALLEHCGLEAAIRGIASEWEDRHRLRFHVVVAADSSRIPPELGLELFRLLQDTVGSLAQTRRPGSLRVAMETKKKKHWLTLATRIRGRSALQETIASPLLLAARERALRLGGRLSVRSAASHRVVVTITIPVEARH